MVWEDLLVKYTIKLPQTPFFSCMFILVLRYFVKNVEEKDIQIEVPRGAYVPKTSKEFVMVLK
jgi:hypothetical protein